MKTHEVILRWRRLTLTGLVFLSILAVRGADNPTALQLVREGDRYVGDESKDKVVQIRSERSFGNLHPNIWCVVYHDPAAPLKVTEVKFGAGRMLEVRRPARLLEPLPGGDSPLDSAKLKVDSNEALRVALREPLLENVSVIATKFTLERMPEGIEGHTGTGEALWKIQLWAARAGDPSSSTDIGELWVSARDAKVVKVDVHPGRLN
jgi:hypothetical protein